MFDILIENQNNRFQSNINQLKKYIHKSPNIKTFIELVLANPRYHSKWEDCIPEQLHLFMWDLGYPLGDIHSEHNLSLEWSSMLLGFIDSYFLGDAFFDLKKENNIWKAVTADDGYNGIRDIPELIMAARENAEYFFKNS